MSFTFIDDGIARSEDAAPFQVYRLPLIGSQSVGRNGDHEWC